MLDDCIKRESKLSEWEQGFIQSLSEIDHLDQLSDKQRERLELIWGKIT